MFAMGNLLQQTGSNPGLTFLWLLILAIVLLTGIWLLLNRRPGRPVEVQDEEKPVYDQKAAADDLTKIEGIGPKVAKILDEAGITTFDALAQADPSEVKKLLNDAGLQMMNPEGWIEQADLAAKGNWNEFERLQGELKGGRRK